MLTPNFLAIQNTTEIVSEPKTERFGMMERFLNDEDPIDQDGLMFPLAILGQIPKENFNLITPEILSDMIVMGLGYGEYVASAEIKHIRNKPHKVYLLDYRAIVSKFPLRKFINNDDRLYYY
jgi:hypothetical protein